MLAWAEKRICVTGGAGFLGSALVGALKERGAKEVFVPRSCHYDLTNMEGVKRLFRDGRPQVLFHLAAARTDKPGTSFYQNHMMGLQLIDMARQFELEKTVVVTCPQSPAAPTIAAQCQAYREQYGMDAIVLLPSELYGPGDHARHVPALIRRLLDAQEQDASEITCPGQADAPTSLLYVTDAARGVLDAAEQYASAVPCALHNGQPLPRRDFAAQIAQLCGYEGNLRWAEDNNNHQPAQTTVSITTAEAAREFGFQPQVGLMEGLQRTVSWCREHRQ